MKNRIMATLLAFCMVLALLPGTARADSAYVPFMRIGTRTIQLESESVSGDGWSYDASAYTLTLNGFRGNFITFDGTVILAEGSTNIIKSDYGDTGPLLGWVLGLDYQPFSGHTPFLKGNGTLILDSTAVQTTNIAVYARGALLMPEGAVDNALEMRGGRHAGERNELFYVGYESLGYMAISGFEDSVPDRVIDSDGWEGWAHYIEITPKGNDTPPAPPEPPVAPATYTITFGANGGTGAMSALDAAAGAAITLPACTITAPEGKEFKAWLINGVEYAAGASCIFTGNTTVTAVWRDVVSAPEHIHAWETAWHYNETHHWKECSASECPIKENSSKSEYGEHTYDKENETVCSACEYKRAVNPPSPAEESAETDYIMIPNLSNGDIIPSVRYASQGERVTLTARPSPGYELDKLSVSDLRGRELALRELSGNSYSFIMPDTRVTIAAQFTKAQAADAEPDVSVSNEPFTGLGTPGISGIVLNPAPMSFTDVRSTDWFHDSVEYVWKHYLMSGVSETRFAPQSTTNRAMIWTILARMKNIRTEINPGSNWYERGMVWAMEQGITDGSSPMGDITREQLAAMLWRNAGSPGVTADLSRFSDSGSVSDYAKSAVNWAVSTGILNGSDGKLDPQGTATRAQVTAMVMRYGERIGA